MSYRTLLPIDEFKIKAAILLKSLKSNEPEKTGLAAERFKMLPELSSLSVEELIYSKENLRHKHALRVIAIENGFSSWNDFKENIENTGSEPGKIIDRELLGNITSGGFFNNWFNNYEEAKECLDIKGGYLLVYRNHFFICEAGYIEALGLNPDDPDWDKIGRDWEKPKDSQAWSRLYNRLLALNSK